MEPPPLDEVDEMAPAEAEISLLDDVLDNKPGTSPPPPSPQNKTHSLNCPLPLLPVLPFYSPPVSLLSRV